MAATTVSKPRTEKGGSGAAEARVNLNNKRAGTMSFCLKSPLPEHSHFLLSTTLYNTRQRRKACRPSNSCFRRAFTPDFHAWFSLSFNSHACLSFRDSPAIFHAVGPSLQTPSNLSLTYPCCFHPVHPPTWPALLLPLARLRLLPRPLKTPSSSTPNPRLRRLALRDPSPRGSAASTSVAVLGPGMVP